MIKHPSCVTRQPPHEVTCNAFAIGDCIAFHKNPHLLEEICKLNQVGDVDSPIKALPASMMTLEKVQNARQRALDYQVMIIEHHLQKKPFLSSFKNHEMVANKVYVRALLVFVLIGIIFLV